jgi:hypothetical protein
VKFDENTAFSHKDSQKGFAAAGKLWYDSLVMAERIEMLHQYSF